DRLPQGGQQEPPAGAEAQKVDDVLQPAPLGGDEVGQDDAPGRGQQVAPARQPARQLPARHVLGDAVDQDQVEAQGQARVVGQVEEVDVGVAGDGEGGPLAHVLRGVPQEQVPHPGGDAVGDVAEAAAEVQHAGPQGEQPRGGQVADVLVGLFAEELLL